MRVRERERDGEREGGRGGEKDTTADKDRKRLKQRDNHRVFTSCVDI